MRCSYCNVEVNRLSRVHHLVCLCKAVRYCDRDCQQKDWREHRTVCTVHLEAAKKANLAGKSCDSTVKPIKGTSEDDLESSPPRSSQSGTSGIEKKKCAKKHPQPDHNKKTAFNKIRESDVRPESSNILHRNALNGQFAAANPGDQTEGQRQNAIRVANGRDFTTAKNKLEAIRERNRKEGKVWEFQIESQKNTKSAKHKFHCWKSSGFKSMGQDFQHALDAPSSEDEAEPCLPVKRFCTNCKNAITGPQWSYLVCRGSGCKNGMTHFNCIGFPDITESLMKMMKEEYECPTCHRNRENEENMEADFAPQKKKKKPNPKLSEMLRKDKVRKQKQRRGAVPDEESDQSSDQDNSLLPNSPGDDDFTETV
eukprot:GFUD01061668.1.p1 GENE.GFUD01061668.1~~GFUD01061668.1.p1  ORF type:complete len:368 (-),score=75.77 GFUD01061668.1:43-1146(-)